MTPRHIVSNVCGSFFSGILRKKRPPWFHPIPRRWIHSIPVYPEGDTSEVRDSGLGSTLIGEAWKEVQRLQMELARGLDSQQWHCSSKGNGPLAVSC